MLFAIGHLGTPVSKYRNSQLLHLTLKLDRELVAEIGDSANAIAKITENRFHELILPPGSQAIRDLRTDR
jgi:hypothetical protein